MASPLKASPSRTGSPRDEFQSMMDYPVIEDNDPSLVDGFQVFYEREVPMELRSAGAVDVPTEVGALEAIRAKVLVKGPAQALEAVRLELSSDSNLFFHYLHDMDAVGFKEVQDTQRLMVDFGEYPAMLLRMLNAAIREPHQNLAVLLFQPSGEARLDFIQNMEYKFVELLSCRFWAAPDDLVRAQVSFRFNVLRARCSLLQSRLADINAMVKTKSPSLLLQLQRTAPRLPPTGSPGGGHLAPAGPGSLAATGGGRTYRVV